MLGDGWHTVGFWLAHCWFMVGRMLLYGWRFMLGQRVPNEQSNVGPTKYVAVGPTLNQRLGFGWRMVIVLAGCVCSTMKRDKNISLVMIYSNLDSSKYHAYLLPQPSLW